MAFTWYYLEFAKENIEVRLQALSELNAEDIKGITKYLYAKHKFRLVLSTISWANFYPVAY